MRKPSKYWDESWNPVIGCTKCSPACDNCWAVKRAVMTAHQTGPLATDYQRTINEDGDNWNGNLIERPSEWDKPLHWKKLRIVFVGIMSDIGLWNQPQVSHAARIMDDVPRHRFLLCTKRPLELSGLLAGADWLHVPPEHVWVGCTAWDQPSLDYAAPHMAALAAAGWHTWLSADPLLGPIDLSTTPWQPQWCVIGGENGPGARPMRDKWACDMWLYCGRTGIPFWFKGRGSANEFHADQYQIDFTQELPAGWSK